MDPRTDRSHSAEGEGFLRLYLDAFWISPYAFTCFVGLREKKLAFETTDVPLHEKAQRQSGYRELTLTARVPALEHASTGRRPGEDDRFVVTESMAIVEYLEDVFAAPAYPPLLPREPRERARARQIMSWLRSDDTWHIREERPSVTLFYGATSKPMSEACRTASQKLLDVATRLVAPIAGRRSHLFETWSVADADLAFMLQRLLANGDDVPAPVRAFIEAQWARPSVREFVSRARAPYVAY